MVINVDLCQQFYYNYASQLKAPLHKETEWD